MVGLFGFGAAAAAGLGQKRPAGQMSDVLMSRRGRLQQTTPNQNELNKRRNVVEIVVVAVASNCIQIACLQCSKIWWRVSGTVDVSWGN